MNPADESAAKPDHPQAPDYGIVIPARYQSTRLPGKPLLKIGDKTMLEHVVDCARRSSASTVHVATDDARIEAAMHERDIDVVMTRDDHQSGSERVAECLDRLGWPAGRIVVNLQGDEPAMPAACLDQVATLLGASDMAGVASLFWPLADESEYRDPNVVKLVTDCAGLAAYFSRAPIPWLMNGVPGNARRHIGLYAFRPEVLRQLVQLPPSALELGERLEQLRWLEHGVRIVLAQAAERVPSGIDTPEDLQRANVEYRSNS